MQIINLVAFYVQIETLLCFWDTHWRR